MNAAAARSEDESGPSTGSKAFTAMETRRRFSEPRPSGRLVFRLAVREGFRLLGERWAAFLSRLRLGRRRPTRLLVAPQDLRTSDPSVAHDIYAGIFVLAGRVVHSGGRSPFNLESPDPAWRDALEEFAWLRHLRAADTPLARENARALVLEFAEARRGRRPPPTAPVVGRRVLSFLHHSPLLLTGADHRFYRRYMRLLAADLRTLDVALAHAPKPLDRLCVAIAMTAAGLCCGGLEGRLRRGMRALETELDAQILPDGGHVGRNPTVLVDLLLDLLPLRQLFTSRNLLVPGAVDRAIERAAPMLQLLRHPNGELALFNGSGPSPVDELATVFSYEFARGQPVEQATHSGYARLVGAETVVIADIGRMPPTDASGSAHAGALSFEMSAGRDRIVVNCGAPQRAGPLREAARQTAAHSTLVVKGLSSAEFLDPASIHPGARMRSWLVRRLGRVAVAGPDDVEVERKAGDDGASDLSARHDGYAALGIRHERRWTVLADGASVRGQDRLRAIAGTGPKSTSCVARFHLHPSVAAERDGGAVRLVTSSGSIWRFSVEERGGAIDTGETAVALETSAFFADAEGRRGTMQIVVACRMATDSPLIWRFEKVWPQRPEPAA